MNVGPAGAGSGVATRPQARHEASFGAALRRSAPSGAARARSSSPESRESRAGVVEAAPADGRAPSLAPAMVLDPADTASAGASSVHRAALALELMRGGDRGQVEIAVRGGVFRLEAGCDGISVTVTAAASRAVHGALAELPGVVEALRRRGVRVSRAEVRVAGGRRGAGGRPR